MFDFVMALLVGLSFSIPAGPMGLLAAREWLEGNNRKARIVAAGVCTGDLMVAGGVIGVLHISNRVEVGWVSLLILPFLLWGAWWLWRDSGKPHKDVATGRKGFYYFALAVGMTVIHPLNWAVYWSVYGHGQTYVLEWLNWLLPWLPDYLTPMVSLGIGDTLLVLLCNTVGMVTGWYGYGWLIIWQRRRQVAKVHDEPSRWRWLVPMLGRAASIVMVGSACYVMYAYGVRAV